MQLHLLFTLRSINSMPFLSYNLHKHVDSIGCHTWIHFTMHIKQKLIHDFIPQNFVIFSSNIFAEINTVNIRWKKYWQSKRTNLGRPEMLCGTSGVKFLRTPSNMAGLKGLPVSTTVVSFFKLKPLGMSKLETNSANAVNVGKPT